MCDMASDADVNTLKCVHYVMSCHRFFGTSPLDLIVGTKIAEGKNQRLKLGEIFMRN